MDKPAETPTLPHPLPPPSASSRSSSRRTSGTIARESLPTPPPDPRCSTTRNSTAENVFKYPPEKKDLPLTFHSLLDYAQQADEFYKSLHQAIVQDCQRSQAPVDSSTGSVNSTTTQEAHDSTQCAACHTLRQECGELIDPLQNRLHLSVGAVLAAYGAVEQLNRMYALWDQYCDLEKRLQRQKECLTYVNLLDQKILKAPGLKETIANASDTETDFNQSIALLDAILANEQTASTPKRSSLKFQRERSKSFMMEDGSNASLERDSSKGFHTVPHQLRRQSTYSEGKSKVSKWTKVKAAFKWERANVPTVGDSNKDVSNGIGLTPVNHEVARYLRVPAAAPCGCSSADSILSSSSGHLLSEAGTPGTISSASSMDELDSSCRNTLRRDSTKSDNRSDSRTMDDTELPAAVPPPATQSNSRIDIIGASGEPTRLARSDSNKAAVLPHKSSSNKSLRKCKAISDFETLPEDVIANIKSTSTRKTKPPLSPLNLNLKQDLNDLEAFYSPHALRSPKDGTQSLHRSKKISSPGNSSVPSSPSRHSDFFAEFESEDFSSGDFSEPTSPSHLSSRKSFQQKQDEINQRYQMLRAKLDQEFEAKRREWEKMKSTPNACLAMSLISPAKSEEHSPNQVYSASLSAKLLEENLTADFKKKLRKWRVKKQISLGGAHQHQQPHQSSVPPMSPNKEINSDTKAKIDWNLWKTGQLKLEGQGLSPLPDQKDLPEEFQKKLEQWNKIKRGGSLVNNNESLKRSTKHGTEGFKKAPDDDRGLVAEKDKRTEKHKSHEKDKLEKLAKLKAIVTDHPAKEIEVKTSEGVLKFEGISRKFTRKLYEWEKARGIGPESSTFALLHPGYCPIDVGRISKDNQNNENSPTLSRSLSLDSITPTMALPAISQQASSLSLNDVNELKEIEGISSSDALADTEFKKYDEPEAVMVEVEDHIVETASPLIAPHTLVEQQTPVYKYEEMSCNDYCNSKGVQSFESHTNLAPLLAALKRTSELFAQLRKLYPNMAASEQIRQCERMLSFIRTIYPYYTENLVKPNVLNSISDVQSELSRISDLNDKAQLNEACCFEIIEERSLEYNEELKGLYESLELLKRSIQGGANRYPKEIVPDINITTEDAQESTTYNLYDNMESLESQAPLTTKFEASDEGVSSNLEPTNQTTNQIIRKIEDANEKITSCLDTISQTPNYNIQRTANISSIANSGNSAVVSISAVKKKRLRKMGSRQNSKTESDSSGGESHSLMETPRRLRRKNYRFKQRSLDEDYRRAEDSGVSGNVTADVAYILKVRPGHPIQQVENLGGEKRNPRRKLAARTESCPNELGLLERINNRQCVVRETPVNANANVFVKTKRKVFTAIKEPHTNEGIAVIAHDVEQLMDSTESTCQKEEKKESQAPEGTPEKTSEALSSPTIALEPLKTTIALPQTTGGKIRADLGHKSLSLDDLRKADQDDERRCHSMENIKSATCKKYKGVRPPLASDSFRVINKNYARLPKKTALDSDANESASTSERRKEHRFRKNSDKSCSSPYAAKSLGATVKKIETKIAKTNSGSSVDKASFLTPDKLDNTLPRISRKLELKSLTPTNTQQKHFDYPTPTSSEPSTPFFDISAVAPRTPLSERAQRLLKAKEDFLQHPVSASALKPSYRRRDEIIRNETWEQYRCSDNSLSSTATVDDGNLPKSLSAGTITAETPTQSDAGTDVDVGIYDSLPRTVSRSGKLSSKLGFATLASKFRRVKVKKSKETPTGSNSSALSELCRQSLLVDAISAPQIAASAQRTQPDSLAKSQSSPQAASAGTDINRVKREIERLNKSQSEQYVKRQKESFV